MGEVWRARDTRLDRTVAIKVLPSHLSSNSQSRARLDREAKAISSLTHAHICTLYDVGHQDGVDYLVMEFVEGESLADRLARGEMPIEQVLRYGIEIADALDKTHRPESSTAISNHRTSAHEVGREADDFNPRNGEPEDLSGATARATLTAEDSSSAR
jgi:serine/threonine protein kinase